MTDYTTGCQQGRKVFALSTGLGKTSAVLAWLTALHRLGASASQISVAVSAAKVEALCSMKRELLANGLPESSIGLKHSLPDATLPSTGDDDRRIMLVTHQRVRGSGSHRLFVEHRGNPRSLMLFDESLFRSDAIAIDARSVKGGLAFLSAVSSDCPEVSDVLGYLTRCSESVVAAMAAARAVTKDQPPEVTLPELSDLEQVAFPQLIHSMAKKPAERVLTEPLAALCTLAGQTMRVAVTPQGEGLLWHRIAVPESLKNVLVLDASYPIRELCKLDPTLTPASRLSDAPVKKWDNVRIHQMYAAGGRASIAASFMQERREQRSVSREVVEVVKALPASEAVLLFVFKDPKGRMALTLRHDLREAGVDTDALTPEGRSRVNVLTWGSETSLNDYAHCRHVILAGVLHRSLLDLASVAVGQLDNRAASLGGKWLLELMKSEVAHAAFQAISRGCCREVDQGQAKPMDAYVILPWALEPYLAPVMPGAVYEVWTPVYSGISDAVVTPMALAILQHLRGLPQATRKVSTKTIKAALCIPAAQRLNFSRAVQQLADLASGEWVRDGHSLVRTVDSLGFLSEAA